MKQHFSPIIFFVLITLFFTFPVCFKMNSAVYGPLYGTDNRGYIWQLWWGRYAFKNNLDYTLHSTLAAPFGNDMSKVPNGFLWLIIVRWLPIITNEIFSYNFVLLMSFVLSCFFIYLLTYFICQNRLASFVSGLIFGFCPYHFQRAWEHFSLAQIQWPALYFYSLLRTHKSFSRNNIILFIIASTLVLQLEFNYAYIISMLTVLFFVFIVWENFQRNLISASRNVNIFLKTLILNIKLIIKFVFLGFLTLLINSSFVWSIFKAMFIAPKASAATADMGYRPFHYLFSQSARVLSYLVPSSANPILGGLAKTLEGGILYGKGPIEQTLYLGWIPLILAWLAWKNNSKVIIQKQEINDISLYVKLLVFIALSGILFSMPPYFNLAIFKIYFPSFFMYKILPMFRAYARFGILTILSVSLLAGIGLNYLLRNIKTSKMRIALTVLAIGLILFEFNNMPPFRVTDISHPPAIYKWLNEQKGDFAIAEYPLGQAASGESYIELDYLFYQRIHQKKIINGAQPGTRAYSIKQKIVKIADMKTPKILSSLGVKYVILHLKRYREGSDEEAVDVIGEIPDLSKSKGLKFIRKFDDDEVYEVTAEPLELKI